MKRYKNAVLAGLLAAAIFLVGLVGLESLPPLWWDEGWTLCVARNWVTLGHYGCLLSGKPVPPTLSGHFPVVASVALSFRLFGVGIWQARMVGLVYTVAALLLLYYLTRKLYNWPVAAASLVILLLLPVKWQIHPILLGRQVLGEMPALFYLLAGMLFFLFAQQKSLLCLPLAIISWGIALLTKEQVGPFWISSLLAPLSAAVIGRHWRSACLLLAGLVGSQAFFLLLEWGQVAWLEDHMDAPGFDVTGLHNVLAVVPDISVRLDVLRFALIFGLPALLGLAYALWQWAGPGRKAALEPAGLARLMLLTFCASWLAWFVLLSVGWDRYAFPALFLAGPFVAALLYDLTGGFSFLSSLKAILVMLATRKFQPQAVMAAGALLLIMIMGLLAARSAYQLADTPRDTSVVAVADFLNTATPSNSLIETYDSELFFLLNRPYHYPPPQIHVGLIDRAFVNSDVSVKYNPLKIANPNYLVVGPFSAWTELYKPVLAKGAFNKIRQFGPYQVYKRAAVSSPVMVR